MAMWGGQPRERRWVSIVRVGAGAGGGWRVGSIVLVGGGG